MSELFKLDNPIPNIQGDRPTVIVGQFFVIILVDKRTFIAYIADKIPVNRELS